MTEAMSEEEVTRIRELMKGWTYLTIHRPHVKPHYMVHLPSHFLGSLDYRHPNDSTCNIVGHGNSEEEAFRAAYDKRGTKQ